MPSEQLKINLKNLIDHFNFKSNKKYKLLVFMGLLGDFDSVEYAINLSKFLKFNERAKNLDVFIVAIGTSIGKKKFSSYTGFPEGNIKIVANNAIHKSVGASEGIDIGLGGWVNMILMLSGIGSPKTIKEVIRGYTGDKKGLQIYKDQDEIKFFNNLKFSADLFNRSFGSNYLRPFELATFRLTNMIQIISNWKDYISNSKYLPQRVATYLFNERSEIIYRYISKDFLNYSEKMHSPLSFLSEKLKDD